MKVLIDEQTPARFCPVLAMLLPGHEVVHVEDLAWKSKQDVYLLADAHTRNFNAFLTNDLGQLSDPEETKAIRRSGLHHIRYRIPGRGGIKDLGRALGSVAAAMPLVMQELDVAGSQRLVEIKIVSGSVADRCAITDPQRDPPRYWR